jgi:MSHA biogenesis protein MshK
MARRLITALLLLAPCATLAQLADPTRPAIDTGSAVPAGMAAASATSGLQSIIQRQRGKPAALINGVVVELGGKVGEARLVRIGEDFVVLRGAMGNETLRLTPGIEKKAVRKEKK